LRQAFAEYGTVYHSKGDHGPLQHSSRGFGFVEMPNNPDADAAIKALNGELPQGQADQDQRSAATRPKSVTAAAAEGIARRWRRGRYW
jgi:RNA recognition motif-containing protein